MRLNLKWNFILLVLLTFSVITSQAQLPSYKLYVTNEVQTAPNIYRFDIYLLNTTPEIEFRLANVQFGLYIDPSIKNGGTITPSIIAGTSELNSLQTPTTTQFVNTINYFNLAARGNPGIANASIISSTSNGCSAPGTRVATFQVTNTVPFAPNSQSNSFFSTSPASGRTNTVVSAYNASNNNPYNIAIAENNLALGGSGGCYQNLVLNPSVSCNVSGSAVPSYDCSAGSGSAVVTLTGEGSDAPGTYSLDGGEAVPFSTNPFTITGLTPGAHTVVTTTGECTSSDINFAINAPAELSATYTVTDRSVCGETFDGAIALDVTGGSGNYNYAWSGVTGSGNPATTPYPNPGNVSSISGLNYGFYNVTITDADGCGSVTFNDIHVKWAHPPVITHNGEVSASCANTGTLIIYASAGVAPYTYSADGINYQSSNTITGLAAGPMTIYVKDAAGCVGTKDYTILSAPELTISPYVVAASSCNNDGSIKIYRTGGIPPYTYSVDGSPFLTSNLFTGMAAGTHTATVKDSKGCEASVEVIVGQGVGLTATVSRKSNTTACVNNGSFQVSVTGGVGPYTYSVDGGEPQPSNSFAGLGAGNYIVTVTDSRGCTGTTNVTINVSYINVNSIVVNAPNCSGTGSIKLMPAGGTSPYTYSLDGDNYQTSPWFYNLAPGTYTGFIKDNNTCVGQSVEGGIIVGPEDCNQATRGTKAIAAETIASVRAFPNPSVNEFTLDLKGFNMNEKVMITVTDLLGRKVYQTEGTGMMQYRIGNRLLAGMYNVTIDQGERHFALKVVKE